MVQKFMYYGLCPERTGAENEAIRVQMVVCGVNAFDWIDNDLNITHRRVILGHAHIQAIFDYSKICFIPGILRANPFPLPFEIILERIADQDFGEGRREILYPIPQSLIPLIIRNVDGTHDSIMESNKVPEFRMIG